MDNSKESRCAFCDRYYKAKQGKEDLVCWLVEADGGIRRFYKGDYSLNFCPECGRRLNMGEPL